jgi:hypothetical protein
MSLIDKIVRITTSVRGENRNQILEGRLAAVTVAHGQTWFTLTRSTGNTIHLNVKHIVSITEA